MSRETHTKARDALRDLKVIKAKEMKQKQGWWKYELRTKSGHVLPTFDGWLVFAEIPTVDIEAYYADRLGVSEAPGQTADGNLLFDCPFHSAVTEKKQRTLTVAVDGGEHHGRFICNNTRCKKHGGLIQFERAIAKAQKAEITEAQATQSVRSFFISRTQATALGLTANEPHPAIAELMETDPSVAL